MNIPNNIPQQDQIILLSLLPIIQNVIHDNNPFVKDYKQVFNLPRQLEGTIVISAKAKPKDGHEQIYNDQLNLEELRIVTNEQYDKLDLVVHTHGGELQIISNLNPKVMPLHFTLLFPFGTPGYDQDLRHLDGRKRVSPREYFTYHLMMQNELTELLPVLSRKTVSRICSLWIC